MFLAFQIIVYTFSQSTGSFTVNDTDGFQMGDISVIQLFVKFRNCLVYGLAEQVNLGGYMG